MVGRLRRSINAAMNALGRRRWNKGTKEESTEDFVATIVLVKGVPFYGYSFGWKLYCKIYLYDPRHVVHLARFLSTGAIMKRIFWPYEAHIQHQLQFMIDFNLHGCGYIECGKVIYRSNANEHMGSARCEVLSEDAFPRHSYKCIEVDIQAQYILNRNQIHERRIHHQLTEPSVDPLPLLHSLGELWKQYESSTESTKNSGALPWTMPDSPEDPRPRWLEEHTFRRRVTQLIKQEAGVRSGIRVPTLLPGVPTSFAAVDSLWNITASDKLQAEETAVDMGGIDTELLGDSNNDGDEYFHDGADVLEEDLGLLDLDESELDDAQSENTYCYESVEELEEAETMDGSDEDCQYTVPGMSESQKHAGSLAFNDSSLRPNADLETKDGLLLSFGNISLKDDTYGTEKAIARDHYDLVHSRPPSGYAIHQGRPSPLSATASQKNTSTVSKYTITRPGRLKSGSPSYDSDGPPEPKVRILEISPPPPGSLNVDVDLPAESIRLIYKNPPKISQSSDASVFFPYFSIFKN